MVFRNLKVVSRDRNETKTCCRHRVGRLAPQMLRQGGEELRRLHSLTRSLLLVVTTRAFGTKMAVFVFLMKVTESTGIAIYIREGYENSQCWRLF